MFILEQKDGTKTFISETFLQFIWFGLYRGYLRGAHHHFHFTLRVGPTTRRILTDVLLWSCLIFIPFHPATDPVENLWDIKECTCLKVLSSAGLIVNGQRDGKDEHRVQKPDQQVTRLAHFWSKSAKVRLLIRGWIKQQWPPRFDVIWIFSLFLSHSLSIAVSGAKIAL